MFAAIRNLLLYRVLGARIMVALAVLGFVRRLLGGRRREPAAGSPAGSRGSVGRAGPRR